MLSKSAQLNLYINSGLVSPKIHVNSIDNLIFLCGACHKGFDRRTPEWVFLPDPLDQFLAAERAFQAARISDADAPRVAVSREDLLYRPYLIREGRVKRVWDVAADRYRWHGDPVIAILRSYAIAAGLQRLPVENGGVPQDVADMYLELVGLYGTAAPVQAPDTITVEGTLGEDTIRVVPPVGMMVPPQPRVKKGGKRPVVADDESDAGTMATSNWTSQGDESVFTEKPAANRLSGLRGVKRPADSDVGSELASVAASDKTGHSNDTHLTRAGGPWKRSRLTVSSWLAKGVRTKR